MRKVMLLEFDKTKDKNVMMVVEASGVDANELDITFNIIVNDIKYGFPCKLEENKVLIKVPALDTVIKDLQPGKYKSTLDITSSGKYFLQPFNEEIEIIEIPDVSIDKKSLQEDKLSIVVSELIEDGAEVKKIPVDEKIVDKPSDFKDKKTDTKDVKESKKSDKKQKKQKKTDKSPKVMEKVIKDEKSEKLASLLDDLF
jgi:hypothetical protein